jgi:hypothetical protein
LSKPQEDDDYPTISDITVISDFTIKLDNGSCNFGLDIIGPMRLLKDYSFSCPTNLTKGDTKVKDRRLENEKEERNSRQAVLKEWANDAEKRDHPKPAKKTQVRLEEH